MAKESEVAKWIVSKRKELGYSRKELSRLLSISYSRLGRYEKKGYVHYDDLIDIFEVF